MTQFSDFPVTVKCIHEECGEMFRNEVSVEIKKLSKYYSHIVDASVILDKKNPSTRVEISIRVPGSVLTASHEDFHRSAALDTAVEKTKNQLKKLKSKISDHRVPQSAESHEEEPASFPEE